MSVAYEWFALHEFAELCTPKQLASIGKPFVTFTVHDDCEAHPETTHMWLLARMFIE